MAISSEMTLYEMSLVRYVTSLTLKTYSVVLDIRRTDSSGMIIKFFKSVDLFKHDIVSQLKSSRLVSLSFIEGRAVHLNVNNGDS